MAKCPECKGFGEVVEECYEGILREKCWACNGKGRVFIIRCWVIEYEIGLKDQHNFIQRFIVSAVNEYHYWRYA